MKKNILIVGGTGFLGYHLCLFFKKKKWNVFSLSKHLPKKSRKIKNIKYLYGDISKISKINFLKKKNINYVINCGGYVDHISNIGNFNNHFKGTKNLYKIFSKKKINTFIQIGSATEYGLSSSPHTENITGKPKDVYGLNKLRATNFFKNLNSFFPFIIIRPYQIYGPNQDNNRIIPFIINSCLENKKFPCSAGNQLRDFLYIDDFLSAIFKSIDNKKCYGQILNIGYGQPVKIKKLIKKINKKIKLGYPDYGKVLLRRYEQKKIFPSIKKASMYLNWFPKVGIDKGLNKTIKYYKILKN